ncbi:hemicentin-1-like isoform X2 [Lethenteron reissneri]|uniref:hemicentin-1-like isoform X2 n=1 Tax=Lethenteron reissneri TaxID=7753 RepID=UPI002AB61691|nr:hemicentin-1-like isoform X2 [Lethenteron reissneri]
MRSRLASCLLLLLGVFTTLSWRAAADISRATRLEWVRQGAGSDALLRAGTRDEDLAGVTQFEWQSLSAPDAYTIVASWEPQRPDDAVLSQMFGGRAKPFANGSLQIRALQQSDSGAFNVAVKRGVKVTNTNINLTVYGPLAASVNVSKPGPLKANSDNVSLACEANSTDGVTFAWQRNGVELTRRDPLGYSLSEDGRLFTVTPVLPGDDHSLTCSASNPFFSGRSPAADIDVHGPLEVSVDVSWPGPLKADSDNVTLACVANATRGVAVAWLRSGKVLDSSDSSRASLSRDQTRLTLAPVTTGDNGTITCHVYNAFYGASSQAALLDVHGPLAASVNVSKPAPLKANSDNVSLACEANSTDGVTFAWQRNGVELTRRDPLGYSLSEDSRLLTVAPVLPGDDHSLTCSASNPFFSAQSPAADIDVHGPLEVSVDVSWPGPLKADSDNVTLACVANATRGVAVAWLRSGKVLDSSDSSRASLSRDQARLTLAPVTAGDNGTIACHASNAFYSASSQAALLDVHGPLEVSVDVSWPGPLKADSDNVTLACVANATRGVAVAWLRSGKVLDSSDSSRASLSRNQARLSLAPVTTGDNGTIACHVSNAFYNASSQAALLDVHGPLEVSVDVSWPGPLKADSDNVTLACVANATRGVAVAWLRSGKVLDSSDSSRASLSRDQTRLSLAPVTTGDNGTITCHASNAFYNASSQAALLDVHEAVSKPTFTLTPATAVEGKDTVGGRCSCKSAGSAGSSSGCGGGGAGSAPRVSWLRGGREFSPGERRGSEMKMGPVRREDRGSYGCRVSNAVSVESSDPQALVVIWLDLLPGKLVATTALNHEGNLSCIANASPTPKFSWFRNGTPVGPAKEASDGTLCTSTLLVAGGTDSLLGEYTCVATNEVGSRNRTIVVTDAKLSSFTVFLDAHKRWALLRWTLKRWGGDNNGGDWGALTAVVVQRNASPAPLSRATPAAWTLVARVPPTAQGTHNDSQLAGATAPAYRLLLEFGDVTQEEESAIAGLRVTCLDPEGADCAADSTPPRDKVAETGIVVGSVLAVSLVVIGLLAIVCFRKRKLPGQFDAKAAARRPQVYAGDVVPKQTSPTTTERDILSALPPNTAPRDSDGGGDEVVVANVIDRRDGLAELWEEEEEEVVVRENGHYVSYDTSRSSVPQQQQQQQPPSQLHEPGHHDELEVTETNHNLSHIVENNNLHQQQQQQQQQQPPSQLQEPGHHDELEVTENHHDLSHIVENNNLPQQQQPPSTTTITASLNNSLPQQQQPPSTTTITASLNNNSLPQQQQPPSTTTTSLNNNNSLPQQQQQPPSSGDSQSCGDILPVSSTQCNLVMAKHAANAEM